jgi:hypothetical protein
VAVYKNATKLTLTTNYTVTVNANGTGSVTLGVAATASDSITIIGARDIERTTDFVTAGDLRASALNEQLDGQIIMVQQIAEENKRQIAAPVEDPEHVDDGGTLDMTLPAKDDRKGKYLAFNATTGNPEAGAASDDVTTIAEITGDISTVAGISANVTTVAGISANVTTVAGVSTAVSTNATNIASINTNAANITDIQNAEENATKAENYAIKIDGAIPTTSNYSSKAWAIGGVGVTDAAGSGAAKEWATETSSNVDGTEYSAKEYSIGTGQNTGMNTGSSKQWAIGGGNGFDRDTAVAGGEFSAKYWANQAKSETQTQRDVYYGAFTNDTAAEAYQTGSAPSGNAGTVDAGDLYFNTSINAMKVYNGSAWNEVAADTTNFATNGFSIAMAIAL